MKSTAIRTAGPTCARCGGVHAGAVATTTATERTAAAADTRLAAVIDELADISNTTPEHILRTMIRGGLSLRMPLSVSQPVVAAAAPTRTAVPAPPSMRERMLASRAANPLPAITPVVTLQPTTATRTAKTNPAPPPPSMLDTIRRVRDSFMGSGR